MATKTITIMEDAYDLLVGAKESGESFSDLIRRTYSKKRDISECFGAWSEEFGEAIKKDIAERRAANAERAKRRDALFTASTRRS